MLGGRDNHWRAIPNPDIDSPYSYAPEYEEKRLDPFSVTLQDYLKKIEIFFFENFHFAFSSHPTFSNIQYFLPLDFFFHRIHFMSEQNKTE